MRRAAVCAALAVGLAGCAAASQTVTVSGGALTIYASNPSAAAGGQAAADVLDAEKLALTQHGLQLGKYRLRLQALTSDTIKEITANARTAIKDKTTIAYLAEFPPGASANSVGILNAVDILEVSPTDTALELTRKTAAVPGAPDKYYESLGTYGRTFSRMAPSAKLEARAQVQEMQSLGVHTLYVTQDDSDYGAAIALAVKQDAGSAITVKQGPPTAARFEASGADALFLGADAASTDAAAQLFSNVASASKAKLFGPSTLDSPALASALGGAPANLYVSSPGYLPKDLPATAQTFVSQFTTTYGHAPAPEAMFGYAAMSALLTAMQQAGASAGDRSAVVADFFALRNRTSVVGSYSINSNTGDIEYSGGAPYAFSHLKAGKLVPFQSVRVQG